jgi:hypothetical protein
VVGWVRSSSNFSKSGVFRLSGISDVPLETVDENKKFYTARQVERARRARQLFYSLGNPSINDMKAIIWMNTIKNNPVTMDDVDIAEKIFGPDIATLKGKTTRRTPVPVIEDRIEIPRELVAAQYSSHYFMPGWHESQQYFISHFHFKEYHVSNREIRPASAHEQLPPVFATIAPYLSFRRLSCYNNSL